MTDQQNAALAPCPTPWCQHQGIVNEEPAKPSDTLPFNSVTQVICPMCGVHTVWCVTREAAIAAWNRRPAPSGAEAVGGTCRCGHAAGHHGPFEIGGEGTPCRVSGCGCDHFDACHATPQPAPTAAADGLREAAEKLRDDLWSDMTDRRGFRMDQAGVDDETAQEWRDKWLSIILAALRAKPEASTEKGE